MPLLCAIHGGLRSDQSGVLANQFSDDFIAALVGLNSLAWRHEIAGSNGEIELSQDTPHQFVSCYSPLMYLPNLLSEEPVDQPHQQLYCNAATDTPFPGLIKEMFQGIDERSDIRFGHWGRRWCKQWSGRELHSTGDLFQQLVCPPDKRSPRPAIMAALRRNLDS